MLFILLGKHMSNIATKMDDGLNVKHLTESAKKVFGEKFVRASENIFNSQNGYIAVDGPILMAQIDVQMRHYGYVCTNIEATAKNAFIVHYRQKFEDEN